MASTLQHNTYKEHATCNKEKVVDIKLEEDDDLFEIDLEAVGNLPPPFYWESYLTATANTLFANCLVPIADVSSAVPMARNTKRAEPFHTFAQASSSGALGNLLQKTLVVSSSSFVQGK
ncbi:hypothetical protein CTI12_AA016790 [Artemisia annua]|uniref:Uncharacterized protein n=1 Tax=Artemisia annua TaxID=35608 RepID=A0A2U1QKR4_ARTAN|nr:hypothetical protein CTI12_AA016790 [Artemisia annua]